MELVHGVVIDARFHQQVCLNVSTATASVRSTTEDLMSRSSPWKCRAGDSWGAQILPPLRR